MNDYTQDIAIISEKLKEITKHWDGKESKLKGGKSDYELGRETRTAVSRYRKTKVDLVEILFVVFKEKDLENLSIMKQGRNSNGSPRKVKYMLNLELVNPYLVKSIKF